MLRKITLLLVSSPPLARIIQHLLRESEFEVVGIVTDLRSLALQAGQLHPELVVASMKPLSISICRVIASIKEASPVSKLIVISPPGDLARAARKCGADACVKDEGLAGQLLRTARSLAKRPGLVAAGD
jgi:DNA-binding NarL/FixJ family response regulator